MGSVLSGAQPEKKTKKLHCVCTCVCVYLFSNGKCAQRIGSGNQTRLSSNECKSCYAQHIDLVATTTASNCCCPTNNTFTYTYKELMRTCLHMTVTTYMCTEIAVMQQQKIDDRQMDRYLFSWELEHCASQSITWVRRAVESFCTQLFMCTCMCLCV